MHERSAVLHDHGRTCRALEQAITAGNLPETVQDEAQALIEFYEGKQWAQMAQQVRDRLTAAQGAMRVDALRRVLRGEHGAK